MNPVTSTEIDDPARQSPDPPERNFERVGRVGPTGIALIDRSSVITIPRKTPVPATRWPVDAEHLCAEMHQEGRTLVDTNRSGSLTSAEIGARLDRLPLSGKSRWVLVAMASAFFFEFADQTVLGLVAPSLRSHLGLSLDDIALLVAATYGSLLIGSVAGGSLADRIGRLPVIRWGLIVASLGSACHAFTETLPQLFAMRIVAGIGMGAMYITSITYVIELSPSKKRGSRASLTNLLGMVGVVAVALGARFILPTGPNGWRVLFLLCASGLLLLFVLYRLPESPLWLASRGRLDAAETSLRTLERSAAENGPLPALEVPASATAGEQTSNLSFIQRFSALFGGGLLIPTVLLIATWLVYSTISQIFNSWMPTILQVRGFSEETLLTITTVSLFGAPLGALLAYLFVDRFDRSKFLAIVTGSAAVCGLLFGIAPQAALIAIAGFGHTVLLGCFAPILNTVMAESFPSNLRTTGSGLAFGSGRLSNLIVPFTVAIVISTLGYAIVGWYVLIAWLVVAALLVPLSIYNTKRLARLSPSVDTSENSAGALLS